MTTITKPTAVDEALQLIVDELIANFDETTGHWTPSWSNTGLLPHNATTGKNYRGINALMLWAGQLRNKFQRPDWATYLQWKDVGAQVNKGEHGTRIIKWVEVTRDEPASAVEPDGTRSMLRPKIYHVFNTEQVDGAPDEHPDVEIIGADWYDGFELWLDQVPFTRVIGPPCYVPELDLVQCPYEDSFITIDDYAFTLAHELGHWTGHASRLDRKRPDRFDRIEAYAYEELVAEISAGLTAGWLQIPGTHVREDHVRYVKGWLSSLKDDPRILLAAAQGAQAATDHLISYAAKEEPCPDLLG